MGKAWAKWLEHIKVALHEKAVLKRATLFIYNRVLGASWNSWKLLSRFKVLRRAQIKRCYELLSRRILALSWTEWMRFVSKRKGLFLVISVKITLS